MDPALVEAPFNVLAFEPDQGQLSRLQTSLREYRILTHSVSDLDEAVAWIARAKLDAVFASADSPALSVDALVQRVRASPSNANIPIVVMTAQDELLPLARLCRVGASHLLCKPLFRPQVERVAAALQKVMSEERRRYQRAPVQFPVLCSSKHRRHLAVGVNLSASGILLTVNESGISVRDQVVLTFPYTEEVAEPFVLAGRIARTDQPGQMAVAFSSVPVDEQERLKDWVEATITAIQRPPAGALDS